MDYSNADDKAAVWSSHKWVTVPDTIGVVGLTNTPLKFVAGTGHGLSIVDVRNAKGEGELVQFESYKDAPQFDISTQRFNDGMVDPKGRFFAGTVYKWGTKATMNASLYRVDKDGSVHIAIENSIGCTNGIGYTPDNKYMYFTDSDIKTIFKYDYDLETGNISNGKPFIVLAKGDGIPDGMCMSTDGSLWVAIWEGSCLRRYSPSGELIEQYNIPARRVTCPNFCGPDLDELVVTTAYGFMDDVADPGRDASFKQNDKGGSIFRIKIPGVTGYKRNIHPID